MSNTLPNVWHLRAVAETQSKACYVCHRQSTGVLITPDNKDFFYICTTHLSDRGFASPIIDAEAEAAQKKKEAMDREIEKVKQEYEEKQRKKKASKKSKDDDKDKKKDDDDEKERDDKIKSIETAAGTTAKPEETPRVYSLHRTFYQMRTERIRQAEIARRNAQRMKDPNLFPSVPKADLA